MLKRRERLTNYGQERNKERVRESDELRGRMLGGEKVE